MEQPPRIEMNSMDQNDLLSDIWINSVVSFHLFNKFLHNIR